MITIRRIFLLLLMTLVMFTGTAFANRWIWCTDYVASEFGIGVYGDAWEWWNDSRFTSTGYTKSSIPAVGSIIVFNNWQKNPAGHVGIVREIVSSSEIRIDHSNWHWDGNVQKGVGVKQASGSWTQVLVKYNPDDTNYGGTAYPVQGFLILPMSTYSVIGINSPYFIDSCIRASSVDSRCVTYDIGLWRQCWDAPFVLSPLCNFGVGGGDHTTSLPDFIMNNVWLEDESGSHLTVFSPGERIKMKGQIKNTGVGNPSNTSTLKFYLSNGENVDSNKQTVGTDTIQASSLTVGSTHTETEGVDAPSTPGIYNIQACADTESTVSEEKDSNNCGLVVFRVENYAWLTPIINSLLED